MEHKDNMSKRMDYIQNDTVHCSCGHSIFLPPFESVKICSFCGKLVFKNEKAKFIYYLSKNKKALRIG